VPPEGRGWGDGLGWGAGEGDGLGDGEGLGSGDGDGLGDGEGLGSGDGDGEGDGLGSGEGDGLGSGEGGGLGSGDGDGLGDGEGDGAGGGHGYGNVPPVHVTWTVSETHSVGWRPSPPVTRVRSVPEAHGTSNESPWPRPPRVSGVTQPPGLVTQPTSVHAPPACTCTHAVIWT
jgi:hypothetical protein